MTDRCQFRDWKDERCRWPRHPGNVHNFTDADPKAAYTSNPDLPKPVRPNPGVYHCCGSGVRFGHPRMCWVQWSYLKTTVVGMAIMIGLLIWLAVALAYR